MLNEKIMARIEVVETKLEYNDLLNSFKTSDAPIEIKELAIKTLKKAHKHFNDDENITPKEVMQLIKESEADISDICNN